MKPPLPERLATALLIEMASGNYTAGTRFLSKREIAQQWKVSGVSAIRSLHILSEWGLLKVSDRSGYYLTRQFRQKALLRLRANYSTPLPARPDWGNRVRGIMLSGKPLLRIALIFHFISREISPECRSSDLLQAVKIYAFSQSARAVFNIATENNVLVDFYHDDGKPETVRNIALQMRATEAQGAIILKRIQNLSITALAAPILKLGIPVVTVFDNCESLKMTSVNFNNVSIGYTAAKILFEAGHTRLGIGIPIPIEKPFYYKDRFLGCQLAAREFGNGKIHLEPLVLGSPNVSSKLLRHFLTSNPNRVTALLSTGVPPVTALYEQLRKAKIRIPQDLSVVVCSSTPDIEPYKHPFDIIRLDFEQLGIEAFRAIEAQYKGQFIEKTVLLDCPYEAHGTVLPFASS